jgi:nitrite reductase/ring-hydroxylating ferredoxin subunit
MSWTAAVPMDELRQRVRTTVKHGKKQIALFAVGDQIYAIDNRCPHEGYPLREGAIDEACVLTCAWHNWKFDLKTGDNLFGMDNVRTYPTKVEEGQIWIDLTEPPQSAVEQEILRALKVAFEDRDYGRISREIAKLHFHKHDPTVAVRHAIEWSHQKFEFGMTHAYAAAADWIELFDELEGKPEERLTCLVEIIDHISYDSLRQADYPFSEKERAFSEEGFLAALEREKAAEAIEYLNGALAKGLHFADLERALTRAALAHLNDFGHTLIYVSKVATLIERLGPEVEPHLLKNLVRSIIYATREDLLPEFQKLARQIEHYPNEQGSGTFVSDGGTPYGKTVNKAMEWVVAQARKVSPPALYEALLTAGARNLLHTDPKFDETAHQPVAKNANWFFFTHALTFGNAVRTQCERFPEFWRLGLLQMACMVGRGRPFVDPLLEETPWIVEDERSFLEECQAMVLDHGLDPPIYSSHLIKTFWAVREELRSETLDKTYLLAGLNRFFHSRLRQKHPRRTMYQSLSLVGKDF